MSLHMCREITLIVLYFYLQHTVSVIRFQTEVNLVSTSIINFFIKQ